VRVGGARPPLLGSWLGWSSNFLGSESGQIQSVKLLQNMVSNRTPPPPLTYWILYTYSHREGRSGGKDEPERRLERKQFIELERRYHNDGMYLQSINSDTHLSQSPFTGQFVLNYDILLWCLYS
jgi:hypothetical protein